MTKLQLITIASCVALFGILYFGFDTKSSSFEEVERSRALASTSVDIADLEDKAIAGLEESSRMEILTLIESGSDIIDQNEKTENLKKISGFWYRNNRHDLSGYYASEVAEIENTASAWNIAGSTFALGLQMFPEGTEWDYCYENAIMAFQNGISLDPEFVDCRINLALCYVEKAPSDNPMKGITMLLDLNKQFPENVAVMTNLGKLAVRTNQLDKARLRFESVLELEKDNKIAICYLSEIYKGLGDITKASEYSALCNK